MVVLMEAIGKEISLDFRGSKNCRLAPLSMCFVNDRGQRRLKFNPQINKVWNIFDKKHYIYMHFDFQHRQCRFLIYFYYPALTDIKILRRLLHLISGFFKLNNKISQSRKIWVSINNALRKKTLFQDGLRVYNLRVYYLSWYYEYCYDQIIYNWV